MTRLHRLFAAFAFLAIATFGLSTTVGISAAGAGGATVSGTGSSYAAIAIDAWVSQVYTQLGLSVNYQASSSVIGLQNFAQGLVDFGASEIGYDAGQTAVNPPAGYQYMPDVAGAICLMFNVNGQTGQQVTQLQLTPQMIGQIFTGQVTKWNQLEAGGLNASDLLPNSPIVVTVRNDASGDNYIFSDYISTTDGSDWSGFSQAMLHSAIGATAVWPTPAGGGNSVGPYNEGNWVSQNGSDNASNYVASTLGTITYVEAGYANEHNMPCAYIQNASGQFIRPSELGDAYALTSDQIDLTTGEQTLGPVFLSSDPNAYPISAYSYLVTLSSTIDPGKGAVLSQFILFFACQGQQAAGTLGYSPLPTNLVEADFNAISKMAGHVALPAAINAQTCPNPYITGQLQNLGEPAVLGAPTGSYSNATVSASAGSAGGKNAGTGGASATLSGRKSKGGTIAAQGQTPGLALLSASNRMLGSPAPTGKMLTWTLAFLFLLVIPAGAMYFVRRRNSRVVIEAPDQDAIGDEASEVRPGG